MLKSNKQLLDAADRGHYAVGAFNISNMELLQAVVRAAERQRSPAIIQTTEGAVEYAGLRYLRDLFFSADEQTWVPLSMHLDHGRDLNIIRYAIRARYTSVMFDGSHLPFEKNIALTKRVVQWAHRKGVSVEAELGTIGGAEDKVSARHILATDPDAAVEFVKRTGCDALAIAIGTSHGAYKFAGKSHLDIARLKTIKQKLKMPLVLHGASGVPDYIIERAEKYGARLGHPKGVSDASIRAAIKAGINKINIDSDLRLAFDAGIRQVLKTRPDVFDPRKILGPARDLIQGVVERKMRLFGSAGKAKK